MRLKVLQITSASVGNNVSLKKVAASATGVLFPVPLSICIPTELREDPYLWGVQAFPQLIALIVPSRNTHGAGDIAQSVECLPGMHEPLCPCV